jgi:hypothetical protein
MVSYCDVAVVGAGPYGLSIAAHLRSQGIQFRIFGRPMHTWREQMPLGMALKSDGFASDLSDPVHSLTLEAFCAETGIAYDHTKIPVKLDTFISYGLAFQRRLVPDLVQQLVTRIERRGDEFRLQLEDGNTVLAKRVVLAVGISHFQYVPESLAGLSPQYLSHSSEHKYPNALADRQVTIIGGGASALDLAALMHESGTDVTIVARRSSLVFHKPIRRGFGAGYALREQALAQAGSPAFSPMRRRYSICCPKRRDWISFSDIWGRREDGRSGIALSERCRSSWAVHSSQRWSKLDAFTWRCAAKTGAPANTSPITSSRLRAIALILDGLASSIRILPPTLRQFRMHLSWEVTFSRPSKVYTSWEYTAHRIVRHLARTQIPEDITKPSVAVAG